MSTREAMQRLYSALQQGGFMSTREAMQRALVALRNIETATDIKRLFRDTDGVRIDEIVDEAIETLQAELEKSDPKPVAWINAAGDYCQISRPDTVYGSHTIPLYRREDL